MNGLLGVIGISLLLALTVDSPREACRLCECRRSPSPREEADSADAVLRVRVTRIYIDPHAWSDSLRLDFERRNQQRRLQTEVIRVWKGTLVRRVDLFSAVDRDDCGYHLEEGGEYLVYASQASNGRLVIPYCSRTRPIADAAEDLVALGSGISPRRQ